MRAVTTAVIAVMLATATNAQEFWLTNSATGERCGPFEFREGATLVLSNQTFVIQKVLTDEQKVIEKMKAIIIPEIEFRQADLRDVLTFLTQVTRQNEGPAKAGNPFGLSAICMTDPQPRPVPATDDPFSGVAATNALPTVTLDARSISLYDALDLVAKAVGLTWSVHGNVVRFEKRKAQQSAPPLPTAPQAVPQPGAR